MTDIRLMTESDAQHLAAHEGEGFVSVVAYDPYKLNDSDTIVEIRTSSILNGDANDSIIQLKQTGAHGIIRMTDVLTTVDSVDQSWIDDFIFIHNYAF